MKQSIPVLILFLLSSGFARSQWYVQYFDGADTNSWESVFVNLDTTAGGIWQIGPPQKILFESASTIPNVLITDTLNSYPDSVNSSAWFMAAQDALWAGGLAIQWNQKLDLDTNKDGGLVEFSIDSGDTWQNAFNNPNVYNFYGYDFTNQGTSYTGEDCFTGTDTLWKNVWLCFLYDYLGTIDNLSVRFRLLSDSVNTNQEGWMIDNLIVSATWFHPVAEYSKPSNFKIYPTVSGNYFTLEKMNQSPEFKVQAITILSMSGQFVKTISLSENLNQIDLSDLAPGRYLVKIDSNQMSESHEIIISR